MPTSRDFPHRLMNSWKIVILAGLIYSLPLLRAQEAAKTPSENETKAEATKVEATKVEATKVEATKVEATKESPPAKEPATKTAPPEKEDPPLDPSLSRPIPPELKEPKPVPGPPDFKRSLSKYRSLITRGVVKGDEDREMIRNGIRYRLSLMTEKDNFIKVANLRNDLLNDLRTSSSLPGAPPDAREFMLQAISEECVKLLDNHLLVRINMVIILSELNETEADDANGVPAKAYMPTYAPLIAVVKDPAQREEVKIRAIAGLHRLAREPLIRAEQRHEIVKSLIDHLLASKAKLKEPDASSVWFQAEMIETLGMMGMTEDRDRKPIVVQELAKILVDTDRHWIVRSEAVRALSRLPLDNFNLGLLTYESVRLCDQMAAEYQKSPKRYYWKRCFLTVYLSFNPETAVEREKLHAFRLQVSKPALSSHKNSVEEAYQRILPFAQAVLESKTKVDLKEHMKVTKEWLETNKPKEFRIAPTEEPIISSDTNPKTAG